MGGDVLGRPRAGVARHQVSGALKRTEHGLQAPAQGVERSEVATRDPAQRDRVVDRPEAVDVALAEPRAAAQYPGVRPRVVDLDRGPQAGAGGAEPEAAPPLGDLDPFPAQPREGAKQGPAGELGGRGHERSGWGCHGAPFSRSRSACQ